MRAQQIIRNGIKASTMEEFNYVRQVWLTAFGDPELANRKRLEAYQRWQELRIAAGAD